MVFAWLSITPEMRKPPRDVARHIVSSGGRATVIQADISRETEILRLFESAERELGPITGLVNNAGITGGFARVEAVTGRNAHGGFRGECDRRDALRSRSREAHVHTKRRTGGAIVNISSRAAQIGGAGEWVHYAASKGALDTFTVGLAREVAAEGIRVNAVAPGHVLTELHANSGDPDRMTRLAPTIPMGRAGTPEEIAEAALVAAVAGGVVHNGSYSCGWRWTLGEERISTLVDVSCDSVLISSGAAARDLRRGWTIQIQDA